MFRSDGNSRSECSADLLTLVSVAVRVNRESCADCPAADPVKDSESWNHSDVYRD